MSKPEFVTMKGRLDTVGTSSESIEGTIYSTMLVGDQLYKNVLVTPEVDTYFNVGDEIELHCLPYNNNKTLIAVALRHPKTGRLIRADYAHIRKKLNRTMLFPYIQLIAMGILLSLFVIGVPMMIWGIVGLIRLPFKLPSVEATNAYIARHDGPVMDPAD
ncbi:hypothetical protein [Aestuariispira ectoiniformans]|uniref:hypothetical protein n=1 Tax=Aestuariispira ectoiniformans TaxID=2775080 RepID=UPI00223B939A|nr:hypothetical protein [Aestuariispira ectoiniformans]